MPPEEACGSELAELVADHVLRDVHGNELVSVVDGYGVPNELRRDGGPARPGLDDLSLISGIHLIDTLHDRIFDVRALLYATRHLY
jgi:hypothetical protein